MSIEHTHPAAGAIPDAPAASSLAQRLKALSARPQSLTARELIDRYMAAYAGADTTRAQRLSAWSTLIGEFTLEQIDSDVMYAGRAELSQQPALVYLGLDHQGRQIFRAKGRKQEKTPATVNRYMVAMAAVFTWAIEQRLAPRGWVHPCRGIKRLPEPDGRVRYLDDAERIRLFEACRASQYPRLYALALMAMLTGARKGELLGLKWRQVDLDAGVATLARTKNGDRRTLVLLPELVDVLRPFAGDRDRHLFGSVASKHQKPASVDSAWRDAVARAKIRDFRFHDLRHCCASYLAQAGTPLNVIAEVLGHRKLDMTRRYAHLTTQTKAAAMRTALSGIGC
ncbi:tyrosine-type recombinase/integrase [Ramlibacter rhizophilus]|uniref:Site-specific integrase n=1 Tax=Ramlibacter rhizophilus TaxID=1781167 RepID=A0A4Z0BXW8_9BURK|nr:site-specific integrase [Ramlibacter rhizophilus]TFZ03364.1 site-specific integrase [Ramlibacter rhizophilus]